ncbi:MAG: 4Fe-4S dicluster domain-containing protein [Armatimonadia bacterium]|nr:4Fe-4S dicluster domain-containing protein [Armatimonadia bacterium]
MTLVEDVRPEIDQEICVACGACVEACQFEVLKMRKAGAAARGIGRCIFCGHCVAVCPTEAVAHPAMPAERLRDLPEEPAVDFDTLMALLGQRRSVRHYTDEPVSDQDLRDLVEAAIVAPSGHNAQPWEFTFMTDPARLDALREATMGFYAGLLEILADEERRPELGEGVADRLDPLAPAVHLMIRAHERGGDRLLWDAPVLAMIHSMPDAPAAEQSCVYAAANMMLAATSKGLGTCAIGFLSIPAAFGVEPVIEALNLPEGRQMHVAMTVGHPALTYRRSVARNEPPMRII